MLKPHPSTWWHLEDCHLRMGLGHKRRKVISRISDLIKQIPENFIVPSTMCYSSGKVSGGRKYTRTGRQGSERPFSRLGTAIATTNSQRPSMCTLALHKTSPLNNQSRKREAHGAQTFTSGPLVIHRIWEREIINCSEVPTRFQSVHNLPSPLSH